VLTEGVHSGAASGIVPSSFRIVRELLDRVEDVRTGETRLEELRVEIPAQRREQATAMADILGEKVFTDFPAVAGLRPVVDDPREMVLNGTWRTTLSVIGMGGVPALADAGNVLRPRTSLALSFRLPPTCDAPRALARIQEVLTADPPSGARVTCEAPEAASGWNAPAVAPWLAEAMGEASRAAFGNDVAYLGEGGSIPFMHMLGEAYPAAQFLITGLLGPHSNAHGPNEFLHVPTGKKLTACVASVLFDHLRTRS
jgi:acetylornithine deacetylase/succinyl-diaminopimelate desuccinylase-like protein